MKRDYNLSLVIPVYNEEKNIKSVVKSFVSYLNKICRNYELILVQNGSRDKSPLIVDELAKKYKSVYSYHLNEGHYGGAIRYGFKKAKMDYVMYTDADNPFDINNIERALPLMNGVDAVVGYKIGKKETIKREVYSKIYNKLIRFLFGVKAKHVNFSFKMIRRNMLKKLKLISDDWFIDAEILIELKKNDAKIAQIGIPYLFREKGNSNISDRVALGILKDAFSYYVKNLFKK